MFNSLYSLTKFEDMGHDEHLNIFIFNAFHYL